MDGRGGSRGKCEPQYIPIGGGGGSGMSEAEIKLLVQNEVASLRDDLVGRMQTAASMATQPLEQALSETQAECRTLERLDDAVDLLKRAPGIEEVDQRLAFSDAKLAAALARLDAATLAASKTASPPPETGRRSSGLDAADRLEQAVRGFESRPRRGDGRRETAAANAAPATPAARPPPQAVARRRVARIVLRSSDLASSKRCRSRQGTHA